MFEDVLSHLDVSLEPIALGDYSGKEDVRKQTRRPRIWKQNSLDLALI